MTAAGGCSVSWSVLRWLWLAGGGRQGGGGGTRPTHTQREGGDRPPPTQGWGGDLWDSAWCETKHHQGKGRFQKKLIEFSTNISYNMELMIINDPFSYNVYLMFVMFQTSFILGEPAGRRLVASVQEQGGRSSLPLPATMLCCGGKKVNHQHCTKQRGSGKTIVHKDF